MKKRYKIIKASKTLYDLFLERKKEKAYNLDLLKRQYKRKECYFCGTMLNKNNYSRDHIPSQCLFVGFTEKYKQNRITIPCCRECNFKLSQYENEFRNYIGITNAKNKRVKQISKDSAKELLQNKNLSRLYFSEKGKVCGVMFDYVPISKTHEKNFRGVFYRIHGYRLPNHFQIHIFGPDISFPFDIESYFKKKKWYYSGNDKIFKIKIVMINSKMKIISSIDNASFIFCKIVYHKVYNVYIIASKNENRQNYSMFNCNTSL